MHSIRYALTVHLAERHCFFFGGTNVCEPEGIPCIQSAVLNFFKLAVHKLQRHVLEIITTDMFHK